MTEVGYMAEVYSVSLKQLIEEFSLEVKCDTILLA